MAYRCIVAFGKKGSVKRRSLKSLAPAQSAPSQRGGKRVTYDYLELGAIVESAAGSHRPAEEEEDIVSQLLQDYIKHLKPTNILFFVPKLFQISLALRVSIKYYYRNI